MSDVNVEYNPETGRMEGTYRVDCGTCGAKYTGIYDMPHFCKERPFYGTYFMPTMSIPFEVVVVPEPIVPDAFVRRPGLTSIGVYTRLSIQAA